MKNIISIVLLQFVALGLFAQDKPLASYIKSQGVNEEGVIQYVIFKDNEKPTVKDRVSVLKQFLEASDNISFVQLKSEVDKIGMTHQTYQQHYNNIPVEFGIYKVHSKNQKLSSINGEFYPINEINTTPNISALDAIAKARQHINAEKYIEASDVFYYENMGYNGPQPTLVIFPKLEGISETNRLAYRLDVYAEKPLYRANVYVDAQTGGLIFENSQIQHIDDIPNTAATGATLYNGQQNFTAELVGGTYRLRQTASGNGIQTFDMNNAIGYTNAQDVTSTTTNFASNQDAVQVHWGTEQTYDYYYQKHGRNSYDDNGTTLQSYVNYGSINFPYKAFWNGSVMSYNGFSTGTINELASIDVIGHEITHGVIQYSAGLTYSYQSGALNESFADIFGEMVENHAQQGTNDWLGAADVYINQGEFSRSFSNPKLKNDPDTYLGQYWHTSSSDSYGVHTNSGVQNKWFYLLSEGGTGTNDNNYNYTVAGIGITNAADIAYRNLTVYLTPTSNFFDARAGAIQSATDLYGSNSVEVIATTEAWNAVGVVVMPTSDIIPPTIPQNLVSSNFTPYNIDLNWDVSTDNIGVLGYNIYKDGSLVGTSTTPNYSNGNLPMPVNTIYEFTVAAFDAAGNISGLSTIESVWEDTIEPSMPLNLMSANTTQTTTDLSWDASTDNFGVVGYNIYQNNTLLTTVTNTSYHVTDLTPDTIYPFRITAIDDFGNESSLSQSDQEIVTTLAPVLCVDGNVTLTINLDFYPEETSWDIRDASNTIVASGGPYLSAFNPLGSDAHTTKVYNYMLGPGNHTLNMYDDFGDGFIAPGGYTLESNVVINSNYSALGFYTDSTVFSVDSNLIYTYNNGWSPNDPNGIANVCDDIIIAAGNATINTNTTCNSLTVNAGAALTIDSAINLSVSNDLTLESSSTSYSSLILDGSVAGTINYERHVNSNNSGTTGSNDLISAPLTGQAFNTFATANSNIFSNVAGTLFLFGPFDKTTGDYLIYSDTETATLDAGVGYRAASDDNSAFTFTGTANNGIVTHNITNSGPLAAQWNLVGNPYPSYLNVQAFLNYEVSPGVKNINLMNSGTTAIYGYNGVGWVIYNLANTNASTLIAPGQGFFVSADPTNALLYDLEFTPAMRSTGTSDDFIMGRSASTTNTALSQVNLTSSTHNATTSIYFIEGTTRGLDTGYDASTYQGVAIDFSIFTNLVESNEGLNIAIQSLPYNDFNDVVIPLGVKAVVEGAMTIGLDHNSSLPSHINVYLEDLEENTLTLLNTTDYIFTPTANLIGTGRFFLRYTSTTLSLNSTNKLNELVIYTNENSKNIVIKGTLTAKTKTELYDIQGRLVLSEKLEQSKVTNTIDVSSISSGVYIIKVSNNNSTKTQKLVIK